MIFFLNLSLSKVAAFLNLSTFVPLSRMGGMIYPGDVAQLVEQRTEHPCVGGSIPSVTTEPPDHGGLFF